MTQGERGWAVIRVKAGVFSLTPPAPADDDGSYLRWHLLDHMPEQFQLPGIQQALRYIAGDDLRALRIAGEGPLAELGNVVNYLVGDPVEQTLEDFLNLGPRLAEMGRFPEPRPSLRLSALALVRWYASPRVQVSAEVLPWRPHRGVLLLVEERAGKGGSDWLRWLHTEHHPALLAVPGVAGLWQYGSTRTWRLGATFHPDAQHVTVVYLDDDPRTVVPSLRPLVEQRWASGAVRPVFAGPLRTMVEWEAWPSGGRLP